ncbi:MAG: ABC transporter permease [Chitinophagaceae bacterium]
MLKNFFKVAIRNLWKHKGYSFLNIFGLAMGMTCSLLIILWVMHERSVNAYHVNKDRLYIVYERQFFDGKSEGGYYTPGLLPETIKKDIPEVQYATGYSWTDFHTFEVGDKIIRENGTNASEDFFKMFSYPLLQGNAQTALATPVSIAISKKMAEDFFGSPQAAIGKTVRYENKKDFTVTAVFDNLPENSSEKFDFITSWEYLKSEEQWIREWGNNGPRTYIQLRADANIATVDKKIRKFLDPYNKDQGKAFRIEMYLQPYKDMYLHSSFKSGYISGGRIEYVQLFSIVAVFILLIACINFMNLTTARSIKRSKEIGVRKVVGALRSALVRQFLSEAVLLSFFALIIALIFVLCLLPGFNSLTGKHISLPVASPAFWGVLVGLALITGLISGSYPALMLSSFKPIRVLKGTMKFSAGAAWFRKGLVVFQFTLSTLLIIGTIVVARQQSYIQSKNLGYDRENLVYIPLEGDLTGKYELFKQQALNMPGILQVTRISQSPTGLENGTGGVEWDGKDPNIQPMFTQAAVGYDFTKTMKLEMKEGRDFSKDFATDSVGYILNETALKKIGYKDPIGRNLTFWGKKGTIVGVMKDFHFTSLHSSINPLIIRLGEKITWGMALVRTEAGKTKQAIASLEKLSKQLNPKFPFTYQFSDEEYQKLYQSEKMVEKLSNYFAFLAIFISCLGLLGLAMFTAEQRTKEFGIRKVLGAGTGTLFSLLSKDFLVLVLVAFIIASPIAWYAMYKWLQNFSYHIAIQWWFFALAGLLALLIALFTISFQALKAAFANPVTSLRTE